MNGIYKLFNDLENHDKLQDWLYFRKETLGFNEILGRIDNEIWEKIKGDSEKQLNWSLNYLYPLLKEGKLKVRLTKEQKLEVSDTGNFYYKPIIRKEYTSEETDEAIKDIKKYFLLCKDQEERSFFTMWRVQFTLPENKWVD